MKSSGKVYNLSLQKNNKTTTYIILTESNQTVREDKAICQILNTYFTNVTKNLQLQPVDKSQSFQRTYQFQ